MNLSRLVGKVNVPSPITRVIAFDYYDGLIEGVCECNDGLFIVVRLLDWDSQQDVRVFGAIDIQQRETTDNAKKLFSNVDFSSPMIIASESVLGQNTSTISEIMELCKGIPEYIIVARNVLKQFLQCVAFPGGDVKRDWLAEMGIKRDYKPNESD